MMSFTRENVVNKFSRFFQRNSGVDSGIENTKYKSITRYLVIIVVPVIGILGLTLLVNNHISKSQAVDVQNKKSDIILGELSDISTQLDKLSVNPAEPKHSREALKQIGDDISEIHSAVAVMAKSEDVEKVSNQVAAVKDDVDSQMEDIKKTMAESIGNKQYLTADALPFHVISVDMIGGQPYVSVSYDDHVSPMGVSDLMGGWRLSSADYDKGSAEFVNEKNQFVKIELQGVA